MGNLGLRDRRRVPGNQLEAFEQMDATAVSHIAICVRDMEKSLAFYRDTLGMRVEYDQVQDTSQGGLSHLYKAARRTRRTAHLRYGEGQTTPSLVLTSHPDEEPDGEAIKMDQIGISHLCFTVPDVKALGGELVSRGELVSKGVQLAAPMEAFIGPDGHVGTIFVFDPDGLLLQFEDREPLDMEQMLFPK